MPGWGAVRALAFSETASWGILYYSFSVFMLPMQRDLQLSAATVAGAYSLALLTTGVAAVPVGRWLDRHGSRGLMTAGSVAATALVVAWSRVESVAGLYFVMFGIGLASSAVLYEPAFAFVVRSFRQDLSRALMLITVVAGLASTIFVPLASVLEQHLGWRGAILALALVLGMVTIPAHAFGLRGQTAPDSTGSSDITSPTPPETPPTTAARSILTVASTASRDPRFLWATVAFAANTFATVVVSVHLLPLLTEAGRSAALAATATGALGILTVVGRMTFTRLARRHSLTRLTGLAFAVQGLGVVSLLLADAATAGVVAFVILFGLGFGISTVSRPAIMASTFGVDDFATRAALMGLALTGAKAFAPLAAGFVRVASGDYRAVLISLLPVIALSVVALVGVTLTEDAVR